ncbi:MAG: hypothetical protein FWD60_08085 [Candidatus Azobacteroides sp.]|nr:hypothetical protein [Candidatus Azobacteroides sp.]
MRPIILLIFIIQIPFLSNAQQGIPYVNNYTKNDYDAAGRNWAVTSDSKGNIYAGNNNGLLRVNGSEWKLYPVPGNKIVRSIFCDDNDRIYIGSFEEFGFFESNIYGDLVYTSLSDSLTHFKFHNEEIWNIVSLRGKVYFRSFTTYFTFSEGKVEAVNLPFTLLYLTTVNDHLYGYLLDKGFYSLDGNKFNLLLSENQLGNSNITGVLPYEPEQLLLFSTNHGIFLYDKKDRVPWKNEVNEKLKSAVINRVEMTKDSVYVVGTISDGIYAINKRGQLLWKINAETGLANNTVLSLCCDNDNNIWAALDNGIAYIRNNSNLEFINSFRQDIGYVYSAALKDGLLYLATNQGLFYIPKNEPFSGIKPIEKIEGQSWDLSLIDGQLFCGNNEGTFEISGQQVRMISDIKGGTCIREGVIHGQDVLIQSTYTYLVAYKKDKSNKWTFSHVIKDFMHPVRFVEIDAQGNIWAQHFYKGVYRIKLSTDLQRAESATLVDLPTPEKKKRAENLLKIRGRIVLSGNNNFFIYDDLNDSIQPFDYLDKQLTGYKDIRKSIYVDDNLYWLICQGEFILVDFSQKNVKIVQEIPFSSLYNDLPDNDENVIVLPGNRYLFCLSNGIAILHNKNQIPKLDWKRQLRMEYIQSVDDSYNAHLLPLVSKQVPKIQYAYNTLIFHVTFPHFSGENVKYSFRLEGVDKEWTIPSQQPLKEYARLYPGKFTLHVKVVDNLGNVLGTIQYVFEVETPFYASPVAIFLYSLLLLGLVALIIQLTNRHITKNRLKALQEQQALHQKESEQQEHKITQLKNEKLEAELTYKSKELASSTMSIIRKNEALAEIKSELTEQKEKLGTQYPHKYYDKLVKMIDSNLSSEDDWLIFQSNFDRIHENFFRNLKATYPDLTSTDLKFCAFLRLNLNTKEMAHLMNITIKGVEVGRYRLRKKLKLASESSLVDFMIGFK